MGFLEGENVKPNTMAQAKPLVGRFIQYLCEVDIDKSGRGYAFPRYGRVEGIVKKHLIVDGDYIPFSSFREINLIEE